ncbi:MAG TPA: RDD family protein [Terracidiphilus sp.]|nr:RDD family protein [Terracidiphilus sp.]
MSTQPHLTPQWKEEVSRRLAAHKTRKNSLAEQETSLRPAGSGASRAAEAAARVAARYAKAPTYSQMQAEGARVAVRAAEIATQVALEAQAAAETVLAEMHAASQEQPSRGPAVVQSIAAPVRKPDPETLPQLLVEPEATDQAEPAMVQDSSMSRAYEIRWDPDLPARPVERKPPQLREPEEFELAAEDWWEPAEGVEDLRSKPIEFDQDEHAHANLIQFPRELVAKRKMRPRLAEGQPTEAEGQLSIFEVDPASVSTQVEVVATDPDSHASIWNRSEWSGMKLDAQPFAESGTERASVPLPVAPVGVRLMAGVVDCALILAGFVSLGFAVAHNFQHPPTGKPAEVLGFVSLIMVGLLYYAFFFSLRVSTPGMKYAGIGLCTFDDQVPTRIQLRRRLGAMVLSMIPVGLGIVWSIFDEDHMSWHDRYSQTYLRKY